MTRFQLSTRADLATFYDADASFFRGKRAETLRIVSKESFIAHYRDCPSLGFMYGDTHIGGLIFDRGYVHLAVLPEFHGRWAILWDSALDWLFSVAPQVLAVVEADNAVCIEFMRRDGWPRLSVDGNKITYLLAPAMRTIRRRKANR
jgi:GNAT superfamily N-acetyltransferase